MGASKDHLAAIASQLRAEIAAAGTSAAAVSRDSGVPRQTLQRYLQGTRDMPISTLYKIGEVLGVEPAVILERAKDRKSTAKVVQFPARPLAVEPAEDDWNPYLSKRAARNGDERLKHLGFSPENENQDLDSDESY